MDPRKVYTDTIIAYKKQLLILRETAKRMHTDFHANTTILLDSRPPELVVLSLVACCVGATFIDKMLSEVEELIDAVQTGVPLEDLKEQFTTFDWDQLGRHN